MSLTGAGVSAAHTAGHARGFPALLLLLNWEGQDQVGSEDIGPTSPSLMGGVRPLPTKGVRVGDVSCRLRTSPNRSNLLRTLFNREWVLILSMLFLHLVI